MAHTPGPWHSRPWFDGKAVIVTGPTDGPVDLVIAKVEDKVGSPDANLIAAAPALLAACERAEKFLSRCHTLDEVEQAATLDELRAAVALARREA
jgi:hypothetical protein